MTGGLRPSIYTAVRLLAYPNHYFCHRAIDDHLYQMDIVWQAAFISYEAMQSWLLSHACSALYYSHSEHRPGRGPSKYTKHSTKYWCVYRPFAEETYWRLRQTKTCPTPVRATSRHFKDTPTTVKERELALMALYERPPSPLTCRMQHMNVEKATLLMWCYLHLKYDHA